MQTKTFTESTLFSGKIDKENLRIKDVKILGSVSKNNRVYSEAALSKVAKLSNGVKSFLNHGDMFQGQDVTSFLLGSFEKGIKKDNAVFANLHLLESSKGKDLCLEIAERFPLLAGFSISARGQFEDKRDSEGREIVSDIEELYSVDFVSQPATVSGMFESEGKLFTDLKSENERLKKELAEYKEHLNRERFLKNVFLEKLREKEKQCTITKEQFIESLNRML